MCFPKLAVFGGSIPPMNIEPPKVHFKKLNQHLPPLFSQHSYALTGGFFLTETMTHPLCIVSLATP